MSEASDDRRLERLGLASLLAVIAGAWWLQFEPFYFPNNDYSTFEATARAFAAGELPAHAYAAVGVEAASSEGFSA